MAIKLASELNLGNGQRCPEPGCDVGILAYGKNEPFAVDSQGRPYCRKHGAKADAGYPVAYTTYKDELRKKRIGALKKLDTPDEETSEPASSAE